MLDATWYSRICGMSFNSHPEWSLCWHIGYQQQNLDVLVNSVSQSVLYMLSYDGWYCEGLECRFLFFAENVGSYRHYQYEYVCSASVIFSCVFAPLCVIKYGSFLFMSIHFLFQGSSHHKSQKYSFKCFPLFLCRTESTLLFLFFQEDFWFELQVCKRVFGLIL